MKGVILGAPPDPRRDGHQPGAPPRAAGTRCHAPTIASSSQRHAALLGRLAGIDAVRLLEAGETAPASAAAVVGNMTLLVPMQG